MNLLLKELTIVQPGTQLDSIVTDVHIKHGRYEQIAKGLSLDSETQVIDCGGLYMSPGWFDMRMHTGEPGAEQKETIRSGQDAAAAGGFTGVLMMPSTEIPIQQASDIAFVTKKAAGHLVDLHPCGVMTENRAGAELSGMYDMRQSGAAAFTDGKRWIQDSGLMLRLMQYAYGIGTPLISFLDDKGLTRNRAVNESSETVALGMKGMPAIAERIALQRELNLVSYSGIPLHLSGVSTAESVREIARAKAEGIPVTAEVYAYHLLLDDRSLKGFDSNYKTLPPLRSEKDVEALREGVLNGTIDVICSDHSPHEIEVKTVEFDFASAGMIGLESCFAVANSSFNGGLPLNKVYDLFVRNPRTILGMAVPVIEEGALANFTVFNRSDTREFVSDNIRSKSSNTPFLGSSLTGFPVMCGNNGHFVHSR